VAPLGVGGPLAPLDVLSDVAIADSEPLGKDRSPLAIGARSWAEIPTRSGLPLSPQTESSAEGLTTRPHQAFMDFEALLRNEALTV